MVSTNKCNFTFSESILRSPALILFMMAMAVSSLARCERKGERPESRTYMTTPRLHRSQLSS